MISVMNFKLKYCFVTLIILSSFYSCRHHNSDKISSGLEFDQDLSLLGIDYAKIPEKSIRQIIQLSKIRSAGYGILLNLNNSISESQLDTLKRKFQKEDINAVHCFDITKGDSMQVRIMFAVEGAKFIWILNNNNYEIGSPEFIPLISSLQRSINNEGIIVVSKIQIDQLREVLLNN